MADARRFGLAAPVHLALLAVAVTATLVWPRPVLWGLAAMLCILGAGQGQGRRMIAAMAALLGPMAVALVLLHGFVLTQTGVPWADRHLDTEGLARASGILARLAPMLAAGLLLVLCTGTADLARDLDQAGAPPALSFLLTAPLALVDDIADEARLLREGLRLRGIPTRDGPRGRAQILLHTAAPLIRTLLVEAPRRAEALDGRGFRALPRRSLLEPRPVPRAERWLVGALLAIAVAQGAAWLA